MLFSLLFSKHCLVRDTVHRVQLNGRLVHCIDCMGQWMLKNHLKLNASKTEFIWLSSPRRLAACSFDSIVVVGSAIQLSLSPRSRRHHRSSHQSQWSRQPADKDMLFSYLSASLDSSISDYPLMPCPSSCNGLISTWLNSNRLLSGAPKYLLTLGQLSGVMRAAAHLILVLPRRSYTTDAISRRLRGLDTPAQVVFKLCVLARVCTSLSYRLFHPGCVKSTISSYQPLSVPRTKTDNRSTDIRS